MKKIISMILALALMAIPFCGMSLTASAESTNYIVNGDFSDGLNNWVVIPQPEGSTTSGKTFIHPGWSGFDATAPYLCMQEYDAGVCQDVSLPAGTYKLSYKYSGTGINSNFIIYINDENGNTILAEATDVTNQSRFVDGVKCFVLSEDNARVNIRFCSENSGNQVLIDNVVLTKLDDERVKNGDFKDKTGWTLIDPNNSHWEGEMGRLTFWSNSKQGIKQDGIVLLKGEAYEFKFDVNKYKDETAARTVYARVLSGDKVIAETTLTAPSSDTWKQGVLKFIADETYTNATVHFYAPSSVTSFGTYIDNVSLKKIDLDGELVYNSKFDARWAYAGWTWDNSYITANDRATFSWGTGNRSISTTVVLEKGRTYKFGLEWQIDRSHNMTMAISMDGADIFSNTWSTYATTPYVKRELTFIAEKTGIATVKISAPEAYNTNIKNISVMAITPKSDERIVNGGFDTEDNWNIYYDTSIVDATRDYANDDKLGDKGIKIDNYAGGFEQSFTVVKGTQYKLSFLWAPCASGGNTSSVRVSITDSSFSGTYNPALDFMFSKTVASQNYMYEEYSALFTADKTGTVVLRFDRMSLASYPIIIDDVSVKEFNLNYAVDFNNDTITMDENYICGATDIESVLSSFTLSNATVECNSQVMRTGAKVVVKVDGAEYMIRELVLNGDATGDGTCDIIDLIAAKKQAVGMNRLSGAYLRAVCSGEELSLSDLIALKVKLLFGS